MVHTTAHLYDLIYQGKDYAAESTEIHALIQARCPGARSLLDVACGTGVHLGHLSQWYDVEGLDIDAEMLAQARRRLPAVSLHEADMASFALGRRFDAVTCLFSSIGYLSSEDELQRAVAAFSRHLEPGGVLVVDGWVRPDRWGEPGRVHVETVEADDMTVVRVSRSRRVGAVTSLEMHHLVATDDGMEHLVDHHRLTLFGEDDYKAAFRDAGLAVEMVAGPLPDRDRYVGLKSPGA